MKRFLPAVVVVCLAGLVGCRSASTVSLEKLLEYDAKWLGPRDGTIGFYYMGSKRDYHYFNERTPWTFGPYEYRVAKGEIPLAWEMPLTRDHMRWVRVRFEDGKVVLPATPGKHGRPE